MAGCPGIDRGREFQTGDPDLTGAGFPEPGEEDGPVGPPVPQGGAASPRLLRDHRRMMVQRVNAQNLTSFVVLSDRREPKNPFFFGV